LSSGSNIFGSIGQQAGNFISVSLESRDIDATKKEKERGDKNEKWDKIELLRGNECKSG